MRLSKYNSYLAHQNICEKVAEYLILTKILITYQFRSYRARHNKNAFIYDDIYLN